jgi:hypothetical protein
MFQVLRPIFLFDPLNENRKLRCVIFIILFLTLVTKPPLHELTKVKCVKCLMKNIVSK